MKPINTIRETLMLDAERVEFEKIGKEVTYLIDELIRTRAMSPEARHSFLKLKSVFNREMDKKL